MTDADRAFLAAIRAAPDDDAPRLIYADWLDENGEDERAELIRRGVANPDKHIEAESGTHFDRSVSREEPPYLRYWHVSPGTVLSFHGCARTVRAMLPDAAKVDSFVATIRRGFIESLKVRAADWLAHGDAILERHPVRQVRLTTWPGPWHEWMGISGKVIDRYPGGQAKDCRFPRWPGVAFELPHAPRITPTRPGDMVISLDDVLNDRTGQLLNVPGAAR